MQLKLPAMAGSGRYSTRVWLVLTGARPGHDWAWLVHYLAMAGPGRCSTRLWLVLAGDRPCQVGTWRMSCTLDRNEHMSSQGSILTLLLMTGSVLIVPYLYVWFTCLWIPAEWSADAQQGGCVVSHAVPGFGCVWLWV